MEDVDSNLFLDFTSGIAVNNTGHCHPHVIEAIRQQTERFLHMSGTDFYYEAQSSLTAKLAKIAPGPKEKRVFFGNSGAEAIEAALKLARFHTKRSRINAFLGAFHRRTMGALYSTASKVIHERGIRAKGAISLASSENFRNDMFRSGCSRQGVDDWRGTGQGSDQQDKGY